MNLEKHLLHFRASIGLFTRRLAHSGQFYLPLVKEGTKHLDPKPSLLFMAEVLLQAVTDWHESETSRRTLIQKLANVHELSAAALDEVVDNLSLTQYEKLHNLSHHHRRNLALSSLSTALRQHQQNVAMLVYIVENALEVCPRVARHYWSSCDMNRQLIRLYIEQVIHVNLESDVKGVTTVVTPGGLVQDRYASFLFCRIAFCCSGIL